MLERFIDSKISIVLATMIACYLAYYLLLSENDLHTSIASIIAYSHHLTHGQHILLLALLPIYIALMIFGSASVGLYLGKGIQRILVKANKVV